MLGVLLSCFWRDNLLRSFAGMFQPGSNPIGLNGSYSLIVGEKIDNGALERKISIIKNEQFNFLYDKI